MSNKIGEPSTILKNSCITSLQIEVDNEPVILKESNDLSEDFLQETPNLLDCGNWPIVRSSNFVDHLIKLGPFQITKEKYPENRNGQHFSSIYYNRKLANGETFCRRWLVYSDSKNSVLCFCCLLFDNNSKSNLVSDGFKKWRHLTETLGIHKNSVSHMKCYQQWVETEIRLKTGKTLNNKEIKIIEKDSLRWQNVLLWLMNITLYLAKNNMAFRGSSDKLFTPQNGKLLGLIQMLAKFDPVMQKHLALAIKGDTSDHYCGKNIQNELIDLMSQKVNDEIINRVLKAVYYSIIADCTPDISRKEQLSLTIRIVDLSLDIRVEIKEYFLGFFSVSDSTGLGLIEVLIELLTKHGLEISNCRGQGYDNGSNMKRKINGVQKRILNLNPLALYVPYGNHSLNLVISDSARSSVKPIAFFGILQRLFTLFSASVSRWKILIDHVKILHLKKLCDTRWEAKISSVKAVCYQVGDVHDALIALSEIEGCNPETAHEAITLGEQLKDFSFLVSLIVWYDALFQVNIVSKTLQEKDMDITQCAKLLKSCCSFLENYRKCGFKDAIIKAKDLAIELQVEPVFKPLKRIIRVKRHSDEPAQDGIYLFSPEKKLEVDFFNPLLDTFLISIRERFIQLENYSEVWGFLYNLDSLQKREEILKSCLALQSKLTVNLKSDINGILLCNELMSIKPFLSEMVKDKITPIIVLNFIKQHKMQDLYPNTWIAMRILLTIPVTVASGERSFSKMKLIKTYLRSTMSQDRLSSLGTLSIEKNIAELIFQP
ncbi:zinc finger MYM-type protein 1-like [Hydra vulgaris]|uniref:zinc finger MYM-type protein 1-like n=1 Tax=Hydra vulgaris TaxID=6087 RepID=UPI0032EA511A